MIKLTKTNDSHWNGNGFGRTAAEWVVTGAEHIEVASRGLYWVAYDAKEGKRLCRGATKRECVEALNEIFA